MNYFNKKDLITMFNDYCKDTGFVGNVGFGYNMLRAELLNRFSKEDLNQMLDVEIESYRKWMESIKAEDPQYYAEWHMNDLPIDKTNRTIEHRWKDKVVKMLFKDMKLKNQRIEDFIK